MPMAGDISEVMLLRIDECGLRERGGGRQEMQRIGCGRAAWGWALARLSAA